DEVKEDESKEEAETDAANSWGYESLKENDAVEEISKGDFDLYDTTDISLERYKEYKIPIIITFGSETCIYCRQMEPDLMNLNKELRGKALIKYVDIIRNKDFAEMFPIQATPATILIDAKGNPFDPSDDYSKFIYKYKANDSDEHGLSMAYGKLSKDQLKEILGEMNNAE
ncbi:MAG: thioredoxin family protein, partial [Tissierellia bacterium]|nr:thioredoxin family protein [Tissierellia bacterium]